MLRFERKLRTASSRENYRTPRYLSPKSIK